MFTKNRDMQGFFAARLSAPRPLTAQQRPHGPRVVRVLRGGHEDSSGGVGASNFEIHMEALDVIGLRVVVVKTKYGLS